MRELGDTLESQATLEHGAFCQTARRMEAVASRLEAATKKRPTPAKIQSDRTIQVSFQKPSAHCNRNMLAAVGPFGDKNHPIFPGTPGGYRYKLFVYFVFTSEVHHIGFEHAIA